MEFWQLTPREVLLSIRAASERRLDRFDEAMFAAWHGALWGGVQRVKRLPDLKDVLAQRKPRRRARTAAEEAARWERFFGGINRRLGKAN